MALNIYDAGGKEYRRRDDDPDAEVLRGWAMWAQLMFLHRGKTLLIASGLTWALTTAGFKYVGPSAEIQRVEQKVDTLSQRMNRYEHAQVTAQQERDAIAQSLSWLIYMQCRQTKRTDPNDVPPICEQGKP